MVNVTLAFRTRQVPAAFSLLRQWLVLALVLLAALPGRAQDVSTYQFAASSGTFVPITAAMGATTVAQLSQNDYITPFAGRIGLGFTFYYGGTAYAALQATTEGYLDLAGNGYAYTDNRFASGQKYIAPLWDNLDGTGGTASYLTTGAPGSRIFTFQWLNWRWDYTATVANISFQVKLYEGTNVIQFIYRPEAGAFTSGTTSASIGLDGGTYYAGDVSNINNYLGLSDASASPTASNLGASVTTINARPAAGQTYTFTPINDYCGHATPLTYGSSVTGTTFGTTQRDDPRTTCSVGGTGTPSATPGIFYSLAGNGQTVTVSTCSGPTAAFGDTKLFVYSGSCGNFTCVGNNDNVLTGGCGTNPAASAVTFATVNGTMYYVYVQYAQGSGAVGLRVSATGLATRAALGAGSLEVFPNPAQRAFTLRLPALAGERTAQLTLLNSLGQQVLSRSLGLNPAGTQAEVDVSALAAGLYTLRIAAGGHTAAQQVVVE